jgi:hypothetical protein
LLFTFVGGPLVLAQEENYITGFDNVQLWIYPEYDDPRLLVMLEGIIEGKEPPVMVRFLVPSEAEMYSAGSMDVQGRYTGGPPHREPSSIPGWDEIAYEVTTNTFRVEYYDPIINGEVIIQQPLRASNFEVSPVGNSFIDDQGFTSYIYNFSDLRDGPPLRFEISYYKSDTKPSLFIDEDESSYTFLVWLIVIILIVAAVAVLFWLQKSRPRTRAARRQIARNNLERRPKGNQLRARFCSQCGQSVEKSDKFCTSCGAKIT